MRSHPPLQHSTTPISTVAVSPDGTRYLSSGGTPHGDCSISVYDCATHKLLFTLQGHQKPVIIARFLPDNAIVSISFDSHICLWAATGDLRMTNSQHLPYRADGCAIAEDGTLAVIGDYRGSISGWRLSDGAKAFSFREDERSLPLAAVAFAPDTQRLLSGGSAGHIRMWRLPSYEQEAVIEFAWGERITALAWHPHGDSFLVASAPDGAAPRGARSSIRWYNASTYEMIRTFLPNGHQPLCCAFSPDAHLVVAAGGGTDRGGAESKANCLIYVWECESGNLVTTFTGHTGLVRDLAFTPSGEWLLSAGWDRTVRWWRIGNRDAENEV
jgi:WD40 repeat protein